MRYSTKLWISVFIFLLFRLLYWSASPPYDEEKFKTNSLVFAFYICFCILEAIERDINSPNNTKYFNIFYLLYIGIVKLNKWIDKQE